MRRIISFLVFVLVLAVPFQLPAKSQKKFVVVIDPGHGGKDYGAYRGSAREKDINLAVALKLANFIKTNNPDVRVILTRKTDVFIELNERANIANKSHANLFISIHTNSTGNHATTVSGAETYILGLARSKENLAVAKRENSVILLEDNYSKKYEGFDPNSPESNIIFQFMTNKYMEQSFDMAKMVQGEFRRNTRQHDKGVKQAGFLVLRKTAMPSLLVELGFVNNPSEATYLTSSFGQRQLSQAIYRAFQKYKRDFDLKEGGLNTTTIAERQDNSESSNSNEEKSVPSVSSGTETQSGLEYRVQIYTSPRRISTKASLFKNLSSVAYYLDGKTYKYTYGSANTLSEALVLRRKARRYFKDAFVIKMKKGKRVY